MPQPQNRISRQNADGTRFSKVDSWLNDELWDALHIYMVTHDRKRADAIRILLRKQLELEGLMKGVGNLVNY